MAGSRRPVASADMGGTRDATRWCGRFPPLLIAVFVYTAAADSAEAPAERRATRLRVEGLEQHHHQGGGGSDAVGTTSLVVLSESAPRFAYAHVAESSHARGLGQAAYHITVRNATKAVVWDSGVVNSANCSEITYAGKPLRAFEAYAWGVKWLGTDGRWSVETFAAFELGPIAEADWGGAQWLVGSQLRAEFHLPAAPVRARAYLAAAGCGMLEINGQRPTPDLRGICAWTTFEKRAHYQTHDISLLVAQGANAIGILSNQVDKRRPIPFPLARAIIRIEFGGGTSPIVVTTLGNATSPNPTGWLHTESWTTSYGNGRQWRMSMNWTAKEDGWSSPGFPALKRNISKWSPAESWASPTTAMVAQQMPLATAIDRIGPVNATQVASNESHTTWLYDFGKNLVGTIELQPLPQALTGSQLTLTHGEWLEMWPVGAGANLRAVGSRPTESIGQRCKPAECSTEGGRMKIVPAVSGGEQTVVHTLRSNFSEALVPIFAWHGFQFATVVADRMSGFGGGLLAVTALRIHPNITATGLLEFGGDGVSGSESETSAAVLRGVQDMLLASQLSNLAGRLQATSGDSPTLPLSRIYLDLVLC